MKICIFSWLCFPLANPPQQASRDVFTLQHAIHISMSNPNQPPLHRSFDDASRLLVNAASGFATSHVVQRTDALAWRPSSQSAFQASRLKSFASRSRSIVVSQRTSDLADTLSWHEERIETPNISSVATLSALAKMTSNAYVSVDDKDWFDLDGKWNVTDSFGWERNGLRGHIFANADNSTIVVAVKGTSATFIGGGGSTGHNDKINDNLFFSCCCARVDWSWSTVCDCYDGSYTCKEDCLEKAVMEKSAYYPAATDLYNNITALYPHSQIWLTGHSLGGALASMMSLTFGVPSVSFESPGDLLPAQRLHLPLPANRTYHDSEITTHVYHTADPIPMGVCTGTLSGCAIAGFALESKCHVGQTVLYDTVGRLNWGVDLRTHSIKGIIENVLKEDWGVVDKDRRAVRTQWRFGVPRHWHRKSKNDKQGGDTDDEGQDEEDDQRGGRGVPRARTESDCVDCFRWKYE